MFTFVKWTREFEESDMSVHSTHSIGGYLGKASMLRAVALFLALGGLAQKLEAQQPGNGAPASSASMAASTPLSLADSWYRIGNGDVLDVQVYNRPQLTVTVRVNERGMINLPLLGEDVPASCRTERELAQEIAAAYVQKNYLRNPQVNVFIKDYQASTVAVLGAVNAAGRFQLQRRVRLLELLLLAGGPSAIASSNIQILHTTEAPPCGPSFADGASAESIEKNIVSYRLSDTMRDSADANPYVRPGDIITVPASGQALIMGNVAKPGPVTVDEQTTLSNAIALAGGVLRDTKGEVRILRPVPGSMEKRDIIVNLTAIRKRQASDVMLQAGDIVEVSPEGGLGMVMKGLMRTLVPTISSLPLRVVAPY